MRGKLLCIPMILIALLLVLSACGGSGKSEDELALQIRTEYLGMQFCRGTVEMLSDYGERIYEYTVEFTWEKEGELVLTITSPTEIAGVTARIADGKTLLEYDGATLETGALATTGLSPIDCMPAIFDYIMSGYIAECGNETLGDTACLRIQFRQPNETAGEGTEAVLWFDKETGALLQAEMMSQGFTVLRCSFTTFAKE